MNKVGSPETDGWDARGSKVQVRLYVNRRTDELNAAVLEQFPELADREPRIEWTAPLEGNGFREPQDRDFLKAIGCEHLADELKRFWPSGGPVWDALARLHFPDGTSGALLVEAKSHPDEIYGGGSKAGESESARGLESRKQIAAALAETQRALGVREGDPERWMTPLRASEPGHSSVYQSANRYAHLVWLRKNGVDAWLAQVLFYDDPTYRGTSLEQWKAALPRVGEDLGLRGMKVPHAENVFLPGRSPQDVIEGG